MKKIALTAIVLATTFALNADENQPVMTCTPETCGAKAALANKATPTLRPDELAFCEKLDFDLQVVFKSMDANSRKKAMSMTAMNPNDAVMAVVKK